LKIRSAEHIRSAHTPEQFVKDGRPEVAFIGRSNVGKSSLLNKLLGRKGLARTSSTPGRTRAIHYYLVNQSFYFVDLPGYGFAKAGREERRKWGLLLDAYFQSRPPRREVVFLVDAKVGATDLDQSAWQTLGLQQGRPLVAATKVDRLRKNERRNCLGRITNDLGGSEEHEIVAVSARTGDGIASLWRVILQRLQEPAQA
jgi:GTP-binding protein